MKQAKELAKARDDIAKRDGTIANLRSEKEAAQKRIADLDAEKQRNKNEIGSLRKERDSLKTMPVGPGTETVHCPNCQHDIRLADAPPGREIYGHTDGFFTALIVVSIIGGFVWIIASLTSGLAYHIPVIGDTWWYGTISIIFGIAVLFAPFDEDNIETAHSRVARRKASKDKNLKDRLKASEDSKAGYAHLIPAGEKVDPDDIRVDSCRPVIVTAPGKALTNSVNADDESAWRVNLHVFIRQVRRPFVLKDSAGMLDVYFNGHSDDDVQ